MRTGSTRWVRMQPLLLLAAVLVVLPVLLLRTPDHYMALAISVAALLMLLSVVAAILAPRLGWRGRSWFAWTEVALAGVALLVLMAIVLPERPEHGLPLAAAVAATVAPVRRDRLRLPVQVLMVGGMAVLLIRAGREPLDIALWVFLLGFVVWLSGAFSRDMLAVRRSARRARLSAQRRAELLTAVSDLSGRSTEDAATTVTATLRSLGFSAGAVSLVHGDLLVPLALEGMGPAAGLRVGQGVAGTALTEDRTVVVGEYQQDPRRLPERTDFNSAVVVPIREHGRPVGVVAAVRARHGRPSEAMVEMVEILAAHLGGVIEIERSIQRQRELLTRMELLDDMRSRLVSEISEHVRDPLTVVRGIAQTLVSHGDGLPDEQRAHLLEGFHAQTLTLRETIDALLDFSRFRAEHPVATVGLVRLQPLLHDTIVAAGRAAEVEVSGDVDAVVRTDPELMARAVGLILGVGGVERIVVHRAEGEACLRLEGSPTGPATRSRLLLRLAQRLVLAMEGTWSAGENWIEIIMPTPAEAGAVGSPGAGT